MNQRTETREIPAQSRPAAFGTVDREARTVQVTWSTGAAVPRVSWLDGPFMEELDMAGARMGRLTSGKAPFLANHDAYDVAGQPGVIESAKVTGKQGIAQVRFTPEGIDPEADKLFEKIAAGIVRNISVGYRIHRAEKIETAGTKVPTVIARDWEPLEISAVTIPADAGAATRSVQEKNPCVVFTRGHTSTRSTMEGTEAQSEAEKLARAETERVHGIRSAVKMARLGDDIATRLISSGTPLDGKGGARETILEILATRSPEINSNIGTGHELRSYERGTDERDKWRQGATASLLSRAGVLPVLSAVVASMKDGRSVAPGVEMEFAGFDPKDHGGEFRSLSLFDMARESFERRGGKTRGMSRMDIVGRELQFARMGGENTISDFGVVLENVMYKTLLGGYAQVSDTWRRFCATDSVQDFRPSNRYRTGTFGPLDIVAEGGEFKHKSIPDGLKFSLTTETKGNIISVSRQAIINDDMGAITEMAGRFGRAAGLSIEKDVFALLAQNGGLGPTITLKLNGSDVTAPLFDDTAWGNVGTGAAISMASIELDRVKMASQKDINNNEVLALTPKVLLVPEGLRGEALTINTARFDPTASSAFERPNYVLGLFSDVISTPRLTGTRRYMFTDPGLVPVIVVAFLNGAQTPFMDQKLGFDIDGMEWKVRLDVKVQAQDPKGAVTNAGV